MIKHIIFTSTILALTLAGPLQTEEKEHRSVRTKIFEHQIHKIISELPLVMLTTILSLSSETPPSIPSFSTPSLSTSFTVAPSSRSGTPPPVLTLLWLWMCVSQLSSSPRWEKIKYLATMNRMINSSSTRAYSVIILVSVLTFVNA